MNFLFFRARRVGCFLAIVGVCVTGGAYATGMLPDTPLLVISEADGSAQMGLRNTENEPLLLHTTIVDLPDDKGPAVYALPPITRVEANGRQVVRFILEKTEQPLTVQHMKRVRFEGIPPALTDQAGRAVVRLTIAQDLPVIISPRGLEQDPQPWKKITWTLTGNKIVVANPSPFVARLSPEVDLLPSKQRVKLLTRTYLLPNESVTFTLPDGVNVAALTGLRVQPASPYGFSVEPYEVQLAR